MGEKLVLIENEFGEIGINSEFEREHGSGVPEMNSGCICCTLVGDFAEALKKVMEELKPDRIIIEPWRRQAVGCGEGRGRREG